MIGWAEPAAVTAAVAPVTVCDRPLTDRGPVSPVGFYATGKAAGRLRVRARATLTHVGDLLCRSSATARECCATRRATQFRGRVDRSDVVMFYTRGRPGREPEYQSALLVGA